MTDEKRRDASSEVSITRTDLRAISRFISEMLDHPVLHTVRRDVCVGKGIVIPIRVCDVRIIAEKTQHASGCALDPRKPRLVIGEAYCFCNETGKRIKITFPSDDVFGASVFEFDVGESKALEVSGALSGPNPSLHFKIEWWMDPPGKWMQCTGAGNGAEMSIDNP